MQTEVIALRTTEKRRPGKILASYIGMVSAVLIICYKLRKDMMFITMCDKVSLTFGSGMARFSLRITLLFVCLGLAGLSTEINNAFDYLQGARKSSFYISCINVYVGITVPTNWGTILHDLGQYKGGVGMTVTFEV